MNDPNEYHCIDRKQCTFHKCPFHVICTKYHQQRDAERIEQMDAYIDRLDDEYLLLLKVRGV